MSAYSTLLATFNPEYYWPLEDTGVTAGNVANLGSVSGYTGDANTVAPTLRQTGPFVDTSYCMQFNGSTQFVSLASSATTLSLSNKGTFLLWVKPTGSAGYAWSAATSSANSLFAVNVGAGSAVQWALRRASGASNRIGVTGTTVLSSGQWYFIAITQHGTGVGPFKMYINGVDDNATQTDQSGSGSIGDWWDDMLSSGFFFTVGGRRIVAGTLAVPYTGSVAHVAYLDTELTAQNILDLYNAAVVPAPTISDISPSHGFQDTTVDATITGTDLGTIDSVTISGTGVTVSDEGSTATTLDVQFVIDADATPGNRTVTVTTPGGSANVSFEVRSPPIVINMDVGRSTQRAPAKPRPPTAKKTRIAVIGTTGKSLRINPSATQGATIGSDLRLPDGSVATLESLAAAVGAAAADTPTTTAYPTLWGLIREIPANISGVAALSTVGIAMRATGNAWSTLAPGAGGNTVYDNGGAWVSTGAVSIAPTAAVTLKYNGDPALLTTVTGAAIRSTTAITNLELQGTGGTAIGYLRGTTTDSSLRVLNGQADGPVYLSSTVSSVVTNIFSGAPNGAASVYYAGQIALSTISTGIAVRNPAFPEDTNDMRLAFYTQGSAQQGYVGYPNSNVLTLRNEIHGGGLAIIAEDASGNAETALGYTTDGALTLSYGGTTVLTTGAGGISVTGDVAAATVTLTGDIAVNGGDITTTNSTLTLSLSGETAAVFTKDGSAALYYNNILAFYTEGSSASIQGVSTTANLRFYNSSGTRIGFFQFSDNANAAIRNEAAGFETIWSCVDAGSTARNVLRLGTASSQAAIGFFGTAPAIRPTGVAVSAAGIHAALVTLGLITA